MSQLDARGFLSDVARAAPRPHFAQPPDTITYNFEQGAPAPEIYPLESLEKYATKVLTEDGIACCDYTGAAGAAEMTFGYRGLRESIAERISARDSRHRTADEVMLVNGSAHGLSLLARTLLGPHDGAIVEASSFPYMLGYMETAKATLGYVPIDSHGMVVDALPDAIERLQNDGFRPKLIYTIPTFQVPTGTLLPLERRLQLLDIAERYDLLVIEDNCYYELYYDEKPPPTLLSLDRSGRVIQSDSFSKILAPGLRMGWLAGPEDMLAAAGSVRQDLGVSQLVAHLVDAYLRGGDLDPHLERVRRAYTAKRDRALAALQEHCSQRARFDIPRGGIYFWLELSPGLDVDQLRIMLESEGVACRPGERFSGDAARRGFLRVAFLHVPMAEIDRGISALGRALAASARSS